MQDAFDLAPLILIITQKVKKSNTIFDFLTNYFNSKSVVILYVDGGLWYSKDRNDTFKAIP